MSAPPRPPEPAPGKELHADIAAQPRIIVLELTEEEAAALDTLLSRWPSRRLAASTGHSRNTLRCWFSRTRYQLRSSMGPLHQNLPHKDRPTAGQSAPPPH